MTWSDSSREARARLMQRLFPRGVPRLWCPTLTHFVAKAEFDEPRIRRHLELLSPYVKGVLVAGGLYDGFLLSTANVFAREFDSVLRLIEEGRRGDAEMLSARVSRVVEGCFETVGRFPTGNAFTNANKVLDHLMAYGEAGVRREPPLLYSGVRLPTVFVESAAALLHQNNLMPVKGYLE